MSEPSKYPAFTITDIDRYLSGKMSPGERNAIEKAALEDPFLADALEGYVHTSTSFADLDLLKKRLKENTSRKNRTIPFFRNTRFMRAAAILILVAGAGILITRMENSAEKDIAKTQNPYTDTSAPAINKEIVNAGSGTTLFTDTISPKNELVFAKPSSIGNGYIRKQPAPSADFSKGMAESAPESKSETAALPPMTMAATGLNKDSTRSIAIKDLDGVEFKEDSIKNLNIVMIESDQVLNEVVVLDKRKNPGMANAPQRPVEEIEPIGGWEGYNNYALSNLKAPQGSENKPQTGDVVLSFDINTLGEPTNIKVVTSYCPSCEKEAKRFLQEGPKWKNKNRRNARIRIRF